jgi:hypothetical protein
VANTGYLGDNHTAQRAPSATFSGAKPTASWLPDVSLWREIHLISGTTVQLRAERSPSGTGRIYTIIATAQDSAGNTTTTTSTCSVPN